jgi:hypothetical protein
MIDLNKYQIGTFLYLTLKEYREQLNGAAFSEKMWTETVERAAHAWFDARKKKRSPKKPAIKDENEWIESLKQDPALEGVEVDKEIAKCQFWCRNQTPPVVPSRRRISNWLMRADRVVGKEVTRAPLPNPGPAGWLEWARINLESWRRFAEEQQGIPIPPWHLLSKEEQFAIQAQMKGKPVCPTHQT